MGQQMKINYSEEKRNQQQLLSGDSKVVVLELYLSKLNSVTPKKIE
jgi:hypothetical protein